MAYARGTVFVQRVLIRNESRKDFASLSCHFGLGVTRSQHSLYYWTCSNVTSHVLAHVNRDISYCTCQLRYRRCSWYEPWYALDRTSESFHRLLCASPRICGGARHHDSVTMNEIPGMSTEANFVYLETRCFFRQRQRRFYIFFSIFHLWKRNSKGARCSDSNL